jgi:membrane protease subunit HflC
MNMTRVLSGILAGLVLVVLAAYFSGTIYFVPEYMNVVVTEFGEVEYAVLTGFDVSKDTDRQLQAIRDKYPGKIRTGAGLYFKWPWEVSHYFDSRILFWEGRVKEVSTDDLRTLQIDSSARWRIFDVIKFYKTLGTEQQALNRLGSVINSNIEDQISETLLIEAVRNENLDLETRVKKRLETVEQGKEVDSARIRYGRKQLIENIEKPASEQVMERFGIQLVDVMFTQLNYTNTVRKQVYQRMISERERIAARYRAQGEKRRREILGEVYRREKSMISSAERRVQEIEGHANGRAIDIWADAYQQDPEFFRFQESLKAYEDAFDSNAVFVLGDENRLLEFVTEER